MKKVFWVVAAAALALSVSSCGTLRSMGILPAKPAKPVKPVEPVEVVYREIPYAELSGALRGAIGASRYQGYSVEAYIKEINSYPSGNLYATITREPNGSALRGDNGRDLTFALHDGGSLDEGFTYITPHQFEIYDQFARRVDKSTKYKLYIGVYQSKSEGWWQFLLDRIEGLPTLEEAAARDAQAAAARQAEQEAQAARREAMFNPGRLNRAAYRETKVEDFAFEMDAGRLPAGTKLAFTVRFMGKPTGVRYNFRNTSALLTFTAAHNFVSNMPGIFFGPGVGLFGPEDQSSVKVFVTVRTPGPRGECSVDIVEW